MQRLLEALEPRQLFAGSTSFAEADNDLVSVALTGPGTISVTNLAQPELTVSGTTAASELRITLLPGSVGNGRIQWGRVDSSQLRLFSAPLVDFTAVATEVHFTGQVRTVVVGDLGQGIFEIRPPGVNPQAQPSWRTNFTARFISATNVRTVGSFERFEALNIASTLVIARIEAIYIGDLVVNNAFGAPGPQGQGAFFNIAPWLDLFSASPFPVTEWAVKNIRVAGGVLGGQWDLRGPVHSIRLGGVAGAGTSGPAFDQDGDQPQPQFNVLARGRIGSVRADRDLRGSWSAASFGPFVANDDVDVNMQALGPGGRADSIRGEEVWLLSSFDGGIGQIVARSHLGGNTFAAYIDSLTVTGGVRGPGDSTFGFVLGLPPITGTLPARQFRLGTLTVAGTVRNGGMQVLGDVNSFEVGGMENTYFLCGPAFGFLPDSATFPAVNAGTFDPSVSGVVNTFRVKAKPGNTEAFHNTYVVARRILNLRLLGLIDTNGGAAGPFGIRVDAPPLIMTLFLNGISHTNPAVPLSSGDFSYAIV